MPRVPSAAAAHIGRLIAERRRQSSMTQDELAAASGIDSSNIRAHENGRAMLTIYSLVRIATALGVEPGDLLAGLTVEVFADAAAHRRSGGASTTSAQQLTRDRPHKGMPRRPRSTGHPESES